MFFITKKLVGSMLMPLQFSLALIVLSVILLWMDRWRRLAKYLVTAGTVLLLIFSNRFVGYHLVHGLESRYAPLVLAQPGAEGASAAEFASAGKVTGSSIPKLGPDPLIVVLSGGASDDPGLPIVDRLYPDSTLRVVTAVEIYQRLATPVRAMSESPRPSGEGKSTEMPAPRILMSGGATVNSVAEAVPMQKLAELLGVPSNAILLELRSKDTAEEAREILPLVGNRPFILVTSAFHMPRAMGLFRHLGMKPIPAPSNYMGRWTTQPFVMRIPPEADALVESEVAGHERLGMIWEHLRGQM